MNERFDPEPVLAKLKDFQRRTAEYAFDRMYGPDQSTRFLVADEVGLGKTLVARGLIAKAIEHLEMQGTKRIDVVYICSNAEIARQNVNRLNVTGRKDFVLAERITMLPARAHDLAENHINFVSFTPGTSFDLKGSQGNWQERAMLRLILERAWGPDVVKGTGSQRIFQGGVQRFDRWQTNLRDTKRAYGRSLDRGLVTSFAAALDTRDDQLHEAGDATLRERFDELCQIYRNERTAKRHWRENQQRTAFVGELRSLLAQTCIGSLQPDLVILDEFQRFRHLLSGDSPAAELARDLFQYQDEHSGSVRTLLLSATPYKMYTLTDEGEDDHYADFVRTVEFLLDDEAATQQFEGDLRTFRRSLYDVAADGGAAARTARIAVKSTLRKVVARTERLAVTADRSGMLRTKEIPTLDLVRSDLEDYLVTDRVARRLDAGDCLEYWKSSPYLLNFMDDYQLKRKFQEALDDPRANNDLAQLLDGAGTLLSWDDVRRYRAVDPCNARLRSLMDDFVESGAWQLLWMPPSLPYYEPAGAYADPDLAQLTKRLVFSSWAVVPKVVATLMSYAVEQRIATLRRGRSAFRNTPEARRTGRASLLNLTVSGGRQTGMPVLALLYPSMTLAEVGDPRRLATSLGRRSTLDDALAEVAERLRPLIDQAGRNVGRVTSDRVDEAWYWALPLLLDGERSFEFFNRVRMRESWEGARTSTDEKGFTSHTDRAWKVSRGDVQLGPMPDDLAEVAALLALAGPAVCSLRTLALTTSRSTEEMGVRDGAARVSWGLRSLFNNPEVMELLRAQAADRTDVPYWRLVLEHAAAGNLQAVLDEYSHVLVEAQGHLEPTDPKVVTELAEVLHSTISLRTVNYVVSDIEVGEGTVEVEQARMRSHFALKLAEEKAEDGSVTRSQEVRDAFNSPFWPFVLSTTSVGQEGLDFHQYCHAVMHWNLPGNPVDMEQREGRVHRYKGHAVRKNLAQAYGDEVLASRLRDVWESLFQIGASRRREEDSDLVPYWIFTTDDGAAIERYVPAMPLSKDAGQAKRLQRTLAAYRLAFGQPRQEDLVAYLQSTLTTEELERIVDDLKVDLSPKGR